MPGRDRHLFMSVARVFLPFSFGYFLSYLFRTINGPISSSLNIEFNLGESGLGLLTSVYLLTFSAAQLPLGIALDRFGPRKVQIILLSIAATGSLVFALSRNVALLALGRALIGLGSSGALMAGLKVLVGAVPKPRLGLANGVYIMAGGLGATAATLPADFVTNSIGWRGTFLVLSALTVLAAVGIALTRIAGPDSVRAGTPPGIGPVFRSASFWRFAPLSACVIGTAFSLHGLWAARWMSDIDGLTDHAVSVNMEAMGLGLTLGAAMLGLLASTLRARGIPISTVFPAACAVFMVIQALLIWHAQLPRWMPGWTPWSMIAVFSGMTALSYSVTGENFPEQAIGRVNAALNVLHIGAAFLFQACLGLIITAVQRHLLNHDITNAFRIGFAVPLALQCCALFWYVAPMIRYRRGIAQAASPAGHEDTRPTSGQLGDQASESPV